MKSLLSVLLMAWLIAVNVEAQQNVPAPNRVLQLDGDGDYVELPTGITDGLEAATIEGWFRWDRLGRNHSFPICFGDQGRAMLIANVGSSRDETGTAALQFLICDRDGEYHGWGFGDYSTSPVLRENEWCHVAAVSGPGGMRLYFNGALIGSIEDYTGSFSSMVPSTVNRLGDSPWPKDMDFQGAMDEVRIWDHARTAAQVKEGMFSQCEGTEEGLIACWDFDEGANGGQVMDCTPQQHPGILLGNAKIVEEDVSLPNGVLELDGEGDYVELPLGITDGLEAATVAGWFRWDRLADEAPGAIPFSFGETGEEMYVGTHNETDGLKFVIKNEEGRHGWARSGPSELGVVTLGEWCHIAAVSGPGGMKLYFNGEMIGQLPYPGSFASMLPSRQNYLGRSENPQRSDFQGGIDEFMIWDHARSEEQIQADMKRKPRRDEPGLIGYWSFDQGNEEGVVADRGPQGFDGKLRGDAKVVRKDRRGNEGVLSLDGDGDFVELPEGIFKGLRSATVEAWVKWEEFKNYSRALSFGSGDRSRYMFVANRWIEPKLRFGIWLDGTPTPFGVEPPDVLALDEWGHVAAVSGPGGMKLYWNGTLVGKNEYTGSFAELGDNALNWIGRSVKGEPDFKGQVDEVRVWDHERTAEQIRAHASRTLTGSEVGLVGLWSFEGGGEDGWVRDTSPHGHHGKLRGSAKTIQAPSRRALDPGGLLIVSGVVQDEEGRPAVNVEVMGMDGHEQIFVTRTGQDGRFVWPRRGGEALECDVYAGIGDQEAWALDQRFSLGSAPIELTLHPSAKVKGKVLGFREQPLSDVLVQLVDAAVEESSEAKSDGWLSTEGVWASQRSRAVDELFMETDGPSPGEFTFDRVRPAPFHVRIHLPNQVYVHPDGPFSLEGTSLRNGVGETIEEVVFREIVPFQKGQQKQWTTAMGLPNNDVYDLKFAPDGILWLATRGGLASFDSQNIVHYTREQGFLDNSAFCLLLAENGHLWVGTEVGVVEFDPLRRQVVGSYPSGRQGLAGGRVFDIEQGPDGTLWFRTWEGLSRRVDSTFELVPGIGPLWTNEWNSFGSPLAVDSEGIVWVVSDGSLFRIEGEQVVPWEGDSGFYAQDLDALTIAPQDGSLWLPDDNRWRRDSGFVARIRNGKRETMPRTAFGVDNLATVLSFCFAESGRVWVGHVDGSLHCLNRESESMMRIELDAVKGQKIWNMVEGPDGALWLATGSGLVRYEEETFVSFGQAHGLPYPRVVGSLVTSEGTLWFGGRQGGNYGLVRKTSFLTALDPDHLPAVGNPFQHRDPPQLVGSLAGEEREVGLPDPRASDDHGGFWVVGHSLAYSALYYDADQARQGVENPFRTFPALQQAALTEAWETNEVLLDSRNNLWIVNSQGVWRLPYDQLQDPKAELMLIVPRASGRARHLYEDREGAIWIPFRGRGVLRVETKAGGEEERTLYVVEMPGLESGQDSVDPGEEQEERWQEFADRVVDGLISNRVRRIRDGGDGFLYLGSDIGLMRFDYGTKTISPLRGEDIPGQTLPRGDVRELFCDRAGTLWVSTDQGVFRHRNEMWTHLEADDGLISSNVETIVEDLSGDVWIGTDRGLTRYRPAQGQPFKPKLRLQTEDNNKKSVDLDDATLKRNQLVVMQFDAVDYRTEARKRLFRYGIWPQRLEAPPESDDPGWRTPTTENRVEWNAPEAGEFTFFVKSVDRDLNESPAARAFVNVVTPWYANSMITVPGGVGGLALLGWAGVAGLMVARRKREAILMKEAMLAKEQEAREKLEAEVKERKTAEAYFKSLVENVPAHVIRRDLDGTLTYVNQASQDFWKQQIGFLIETGQGWKDLPGTFSEDQVKEIVDRHDLVARTGEHLGRAIKFQPPGEEPFWLQDIQTPLRDGEGKIVGVQTVIWDVTEENQAAERLREAKEAADEANKAKSLFLANMSHEIRTPMNAILGYSQILKRDRDLPDRHRESIETIESSGDHLLAMINDILDLSKIEAGRMDLQESDFDLNELITGITTLFQLRCDESELQLQVVAFDDQPVPVHGDEGKLRQVLINLMGNAVKFTESGEVTLKVRRVGQVEKHLYRFDVIDTGPGISEDDQQAIFQPFQQSTAGLSQGGTGLGLAITRRQIELMGGEVELESTVGKGSRFYFTIALSPAVGEVVREEAKDGREVKHLAPGQTAEVLVVDDNRQNRDVLSQVLESIGCQVRVAESAFEAFDRIQEKAPDLIFMDIRMPEMNGAEATRKIIAEHGPDAIKVVAITASVLDHERAGHMAAGFHGFLSKPFRFPEICDALKDLLGVEYEYADEGVPKKEERVELDPASVTLPAEVWQGLTEAADRFSLTGLKKAMEGLDSADPGHQALAVYLRQRMNEGALDEVSAFLEKVARD